MTGNGVMHNGTTVQDRYGSSLDRIIVCEILCNIEFELLKSIMEFDLIQVGDRVGVMRQLCGTLHFYINGIDQGPATTNVPENVYGVIGKLLLYRCCKGLLKVSETCRSIDFVFAP